MVVLALACTACSGGDDSPASKAGCGLVPESEVVGLLGSDVDATAKGSAASLRSKHVTASCRTVDSAHSRYVDVVATYHPKPYPLPKNACDEGWVYAGTPDKYTPACQHFAHGKGTTELIVRWQPYVMRVTIGRPNRDWGGDPERALQMTRALAQDLGVKEAASDG